MPVPPPTAYPAGMHLTVGSHEVEIEKFIGEGGFAHVYTVQATPPIPGHEITCLKRVQVPNKAYLNLLRAEVDAMQRLKGCSNVVEYFDSHAERMHSPQAQGQYEVFLLMEYCEGGGLIDFMNTRLRDQLREHEILKIMYDITLGLAHMHYLAPPLLHRDLKIENVLITGDGTFKLCDFGSVSPVLRPPKTPQEFQILEDDIQHHTTVQYRAPEMVDIARGHPIDEKSDIWALGIFLYKLCYYTTPFERPNQTLEQFQQLILAGVFTIPARPAYSERLRNMIRVLLQPDPRLRPNVFQVMQEICAMRHVECPIQDIYSRPQAQQLPVSAAAGGPASSSSSSSAVAPGGGAVGAGVLPLGPPVGPPVGPATGAPMGPATGAPMGPPVGTIAQPFETQPFNQMAPGQIGPGQIVPTGQLPPHYQVGAGQLAVPNLPPRPAPGQVPVPGVLLTSPLMTPTSPLSRPISPLDDEQHVAARFPSLEELDRANTSSLVDFNPPKQGSSTNLATANTTSAASAKQPKTAAPAPAAPAAAQDTTLDYPMPQRPSRPARPTRDPRPKSYSEDTQPSSIQSSGAPGGAPGGAQGGVQGGAQGGAAPKIDVDSKPVSAEAAKLKQILTGISGKSSTVIMDQPPENKNLSSMDFLRTLQTGDGTSHHHHHLYKPHRPHRPHRSRKTFPSNYEYDHGDDDDDDDDDDDAFSGLPRHENLSSPQAEYDVEYKLRDDPADEFSFSDSSPLTSPAKPKPKPYADPVNKPPLMKSFDRPLSKSFDSARDKSFEKMYTDPYKESYDTSEKQQHQQQQYSNSSNKINNNNNEQYSDGDEDYDEDYDEEQYEDGKSRNEKPPRPYQGKPMLPRSPQSAAKPQVSKLQIAKPGSSKTGPGLLASSSNHNKPRLGPKPSVTPPLDAKTLEPKTLLSLKTPLIGVSIGSIKSSSGPPPKPPVHSQSMHSQSMHSQSMHAKSAHAQSSHAKSVPASPKPLVPRRTGPAVPPSSAKPALRVSTAPVLRTTKPRPKSVLLGSRELTGQATGPDDEEFESFRPTNSIQQRVHSFLSSHDRQHPPIRTARGYGQFTPDTDRDDDGLIRATRSRSLGDAVPAPPPRDLKPKVNIK